MPHPGPALTAEEQRVQAYIDGVANKGFDLLCTGGHHHKGIPPRKAEEIFLGVPSNDSCAAASERYTAHAHPGGSGWDFVTAQMVKGDWERELGLTASWYDENVFDAGSAESQSRVRDSHKAKDPYVWIDTYYPVMNTPVHAAVTLLSDPPVHAKLREAKLEGDPGSELADEVRVFHGLSVSGDVTAQFIYAGYGRKEDFDLLQSRGVDFTGKIAVVKYGGNFRGLKVKAAQEAGAVGCIIFTDPGDDGEMTEWNGHRQYPAGPARVQSSVQRGSVQFLSKYPGDPTTPGKPAYKNATRDAGGNFPSIPSLPMSYEDVIPILHALKGHGIPASDLGAAFGGGLTHWGVEYWTGPSSTPLRLVNEVNRRVMPVWNTMAYIPGHVRDEVVLMGNHRDAWVLGGADPNSGTASQLDMVRGLGTLLRKGWRPMRSIVLASWDAEEYGLIGSTEWAEDFGDWLQANAVAYLNFDSSASGSNFGGAASPSLALLLRGAAEQITTPDGRSVWAARADGGVWDAASVHAEADENEEKGSGIRPLGSGSDYTAFLQRYGVAATDFSFKGGPKDPVYHYHSVYDSHTWMRKFGDPEFARHAQGAQIIGLVLLRLADALILPLNTTQYARDLEYYKERVAGLGGGVDLAPLGAAIGELQRASARLDAHREKLLQRLKKALPKTWCWGKRDEVRKILREIRAVNLKLRDFEKGFISEEGIVDREWYKHKGTAPGKWLGYGATTFPALTEAITIEKDEELARKEAQELTDMISSMAKRLDK
ncbi:Zn-dependent exopeptidase [Cutaneotrichosporon oleaginosum]|uniref:Zn-dependent exopeptidase n=1 Tax=Cutaneotrichosporon oleaginosum TaxID=879819 RepID=A0A0J0XT54_9TREE|nr:Zn-dependent exopeptidase [Cutaneotrichosporon oleaginosum]KLT44260.1 Zn-dependent exopeptidase [Cutaneotrichosporon oleaginosum]TXT11572.1 hypothetical protein COLE_01982 [Cutaneotrichosporon oleaginosum]